MDPKKIEKEKKKKPDQPPPMNPDSQRGFKNMPESGLCPSCGKCLMTIYLHSYEANISTCDCGNVYKVLSLDHEITGIYLIANMEAINARRRKGK